MHSVKHHESGRRRSIKNPKGATYYEAPHLAHLTPIEFDDLNAALADNNARYRRGKNGCDCRRGISRKRTRSPGQHACCWYCGRPYVWGGNGITENLMCNGARDWKCWNSIGFNGELAAKRLAEVIRIELYRLDGFEDQYAEMVELAINGGSHGLDQQWAALRRDEAVYERDRKNVQASILALGPYELLQSQLAELTTRAAELGTVRTRLEYLSNKSIAVPKSAAMLKSSLEEQLDRLAVGSPEFGDLMRHIVPEFHVFLVRLVDGGMLFPRARIKLNLAGSIEDAALLPGLREMLSRVEFIDLFGPPVQREAIREETVRLVAEGHPHREVVKLLKEQPTLPVISNALNLDKKMKSLGLDSPYVIVREPPSDFTKLRRHKNSKYQFGPLEGYVPPPLSKWLICPRGHFEPRQLCRGFFHSRTNNHEESRQNCPIARAPNCLSVGPRIAAIPSCPGCCRGRSDRVCQVEHASRSVART